MKVVIIEDEAPAAARLKKMLLAAGSAAGPGPGAAAGVGGHGPSSFGVEVVAVLDTLAAARAWLRANPSPDLLFMDIELSDGLSMDLIREFRVGCPVVFVTAYDEYWQEAFERNGIDYLLKPVKAERLEGALRKFEEMREYFMTRYRGLVEDRGSAAGGGAAGVRGGSGGVAGGGAAGTAFKEKFLVRRGLEYVSIRVEDIAYFHASHKLVCLVRKDGAKFMLDHSVSDIAKEVDEGMFYRVNRKYLVNAAAIRKVSALAKSRISVQVEPAAKEELVVSSENSAAFKKWLGR